MHLMLMFGGRNGLDGCLRHGQYTLLTQICVWQQHPANVHQAKLPESKSLKDSK